MSNGDVVSRKAVYPHRRTHQFLVTLVWVTILGALGLKASSKIQEIAFLKAHGLHSTATVTETWPCGGQRYVSPFSGNIVREQYCGMITLKIPDGRHFALFVKSSDEWRLGTPVDVVYNPNSPSTFMMADALVSPTDYYPILMMLKVIGLAFLVIGVSVLTIYIASFMDPNEKKRRLAGESDTDPYETGK